MLALGAALLSAALAYPGAEAAKPKIRNGGVFHITFAGNLGRIDPTVADVDLFPILDATCARLMSYPDKPPPEGFRLVPEVSAGYPRVSQDGRTYTFTLRRGFRFNNGGPVRASAFEKAITRALKLGSGVGLVSDIVGAERVLEGKAQTVSGLIAHGNRLVIRLTRPAPAFPARMAAPWFCAVPPSLPVDPEGVSRFAAAGPYYVATNVPGRRIVLKRNHFYRGSRPHHVDSFVVDNNASSFADVLNRIERGAADWGSAPTDIYLDPSRKLMAKYGRNKTQFFLEPGLFFRHYHLNTSRGIFRNNTRLRRAVNFAIDRSAVARAAEGSLGSTLTDQYLPPWLPGFRNAHIYPLQHPDLRKARALARGHLRARKAVLYTLDVPGFKAAGQIIAQDLAKIGLSVEVKGIPPRGYFDRIVGNLDEPWDMAWADWAPDHLDPSAYLNALLDGQFVGDMNLSHFNSKKYNRLLRRTATLRGRGRYRAYGALDIRLARDAAPIVAISYLNVPTLISKRVDKRCIVLRPDLDLAAVCLK